MVLAFAGLSCARALALRGWQKTVIEQASRARRVHRVLRDYFDPKSRLLLRSMALSTSLFVFAQYSQNDVL